MSDDTGTTSRRWRNAADLLFYRVRHLLGGDVQALGQHPSSDESMTRYIASYSVPLTTGERPPELIEGSGLMAAVMRNRDGTRVYFRGMGERTPLSILQFGDTRDTLSRHEQPEDERHVQADGQPHEPANLATVSDATGAAARRKEKEPRRKRRRGHEHEQLEQGLLASNSSAFNATHRVRRQRANRLSSANVWEVAMDHAFGIVRAFIQVGDPGKACTSERIGHHGCAASLVVATSSIAVTTTSPGAFRRSAKLTIFVRFAPLAWHEQCDAPGATGAAAVTLMLCQESTDNGGLRGLCSCDELAECRPREESSPCTHVEYAFHEIRPVASQISASGLQIRECLTKAERGSFPSHEVRDSLALVRLLPNLRFIGSRKVTNILLWYRGDLAVPIYMVARTRKNGQDINLFECQRCRGTANRRGACDHELDAERHLDSTSHEDASLHASTNCGASASGLEFTNGDFDHPEDRTTVSNRGAVDALESTANDIEGGIQHGAETGSHYGVFANSAAARAAGHIWSDDQEQGKNTLRHSEYVSRSRRSPFPCASDFIASVYMKSLVDESLPGPVSLPELMDNRAKCFGRKDNNSLCLYMSTDVPSEEKFGTRAMLLHGLTDRHLRVFVRDWICPKCSNVVRYDGFDDGLFSSSSTRLWSRTALDAFLAGSARFSASGRATAGMSAELERARSYGERLDQTDTRLSEAPGRKQQSDAAAAYLSLLGDPQGRPGAMSRVFRCESGCEGPKGPKIVIGDGTAAGIFKNLPVYDRPAEVLAPLPTVLSARQFMLHAKNEREAVRFLCRRALSRQVPPASDAADELELSRLEAEEIPISRLCTEGKPCRTETRKQRSKAIEDMLSVSDTESVQHGSSQSTDIVRSLHEKCRLKLGDGNMTEHAIADFGEHRRLSLRLSWSSDVANEVGELSYAATSIFMQQMFELTEFEPESEQAAFPEPGMQTESLPPRQAVAGREDGLFARPLLPSDELRRASYNLALSCCADSPHVFLMETSAQSEALAFASVLGSLSKVQSVDRAQSVARIGFAAVQLSSVPFIRGFMVALSVSLQNRALSSTVWPQLQRLCEAVCWILRSSVLTVYSFEKTYNKNAPDSCKGYESLHREGRNGPSGALEDSFLEASRTGHLYPGRKAMRPAIEFSADPIASCNKEYPVSRALSPGLLIFCCGCQNPIIQGLSAMTAAESRCFMWSVVLVFLLTESLEFVFYDNACGLRQSVVLRALWSLRKPRLLVDRFHIQGHVCGPAFDAEVMHVANNSRSASVECVNALIGAVKASMRYIRPENYLAFSGLRALLLNVSAKWRKLTGATDCDTADLSVLGNILMPCGCHRCEHGRASSDKFREIEAELFSERRIANRGAASSASIARAMEYERRRSLSVFGSRSWYNPETGRMVRPGAFD